MMGGRATRALHESNWSHEAGYGSAGALTGGRPSDREPVSENDRLRKVQLVLCVPDSLKLNDVDPQAWLADVLDRIADHRASRLHELLPWNWSRATRTDA